ncbi:MAG: HAD family hydrolase [Planctomycetota bacterium]|nr:MAG: HAD family hydrolase [Planctomycetota bacterium]
MVQRVQAVLFDMDGVLIESIDAWYALIEDAARMLGKPAPSRERYARHFGQTAHDDARLFFDEAIGGEELDAFYAERFARHMDRVRLMPGALEVLERLRALGRKVGCVTNTVVPLAREIQAATGLADRLDVAVAHGDCPRGKPAPDLVLLALERLGGLAPERALLVGDSRFDMEAARAAGVTPVGFRRDDGAWRIDELPALLDRLR